MTTQKLSTVVGMVLLACGCTPKRAAPDEPEWTGQPYDQAVRIMCDVDKLADVDPDDPLGADEARFAYMNEHVEHPDAIFLRTFVQVKPQPEKAQLLRSAATKAGLAGCALADVYEDDESLEL